MFTRLVKLSAPKIAGSYLVFGVLWIGTTDWVVLRIARTQSQILWMQAVKGWLFVALSGALVFGLVSLRETQLHGTQGRLQTATEQLQVIHRVFRHNLRNELTVIRGNIGLVKSSTDQQELKQQLDNAEKGIDRLELLNEDLQILDEIQDSDTAVADLSSIIEDECDRLQSQYPSITIDLDMPVSIKVAAGNSLKYLIRRMLEALSVRYSDTPENAHLQLTVTQTTTEVSLVARSLDHQIPQIEISPLRSGEERPLKHALGVDLWVLKWLANRFDGEVDIRVTTNDTIISISLQPDAPLEQLVNEALQPLSMSVSDLR